MPGLGILLLRCDIGEVDDMNVVLSQFLTLFILRLSLALVGLLLWLGGNVDRLHRNSKQSFVVVIFFFTLAGSLGVLDLERWSLHTLTNMPLGWLRSV